MSIGQFGHVYDWRAVEAYAANSRTPVFGAAAGPDVRGSGKGKIALLHKIVEKVAGKVFVRNQTAPDCVSQGFSGAIDTLICCEIHAGERERWMTNIASEPTYGFSRIEIGRGRLGNDGGSTGAWGAQAITQYGTLLMRPYGGVDLTRYDGKRANAWGAPRAGVPDALESIAKEHPVKTTTLITSYEDARDAIFNGYPVVVCSMQGFSDYRDEDGFAKPQGAWPHCMYFIGMDDEFRRPGLLCANSWGPDWIRGPTRHGQPGGSFWVDAEPAGRMLSRNPDSYAISGFIGYPAAEVVYDWY